MARLWVTIALAGLAMLAACGREKPAATQAAAATGPAGRKTPAAFRYGVVVEPQYDEVKKFRRGYAAVRKGRVWGIVDRAGKEVVSPTYDNLIVGSTDHFELVQGGRQSAMELVTDTGLQRFPYWDGGLRGIFDLREGRVTITPAYESVSVSKDDYYVVRLSGKAGVADKSGKLVVPCTLREIGVFGDGLAAYRGASGKWGYINGAGDTKIGATFDEAGPFSEGLAAVKVGTRYGYINAAGEMVIAPTWDSVSAFKNKRAEVSDGLRRAVINETGAYVIKPMPASTIDILENGAIVVEPGEGRERELYDHDGKAFGLGRCRMSLEVCGRIMVAQGSKFGVVGADGKVLVPLEYDLVWPTHGGNFACKREGRFNIINGAGKQLAPAAFGMLRSAEDSPLLAVRVNDKWALARDDGTLLTELKFEEMAEPADGMAAIRVENKWGFVGPLGR